MNADRIEKRILLDAPLERVWRAISEASQFGSWFGMAVEGEFVAGTTVVGRIQPTTVDAHVAELQRPHAGLAFSLQIVSVEPMRLFAFRWHPHAVNPQQDYSREPTTLVRFELAPQADGVLLTITESGFEQIPLARRAQAFTANDGGWREQLRMIEKYLALPQS
ncbi:Uncharacterized conserved protein YndB, AHSA1/START domain [Solimonas aquatica]|uniref:Uncharacterized conserved protein YndB, AHSA1/START domain n=1 Tax=Solimonas aquatica TaxID=489703 RepID=A0A1H9I134_9GAMM|nr:SRPBCC family protein [Solimonas aquatica]SEQ68248.1 Uncharacterized conserved protein YndB, AHSA1/START domain [Solimonas aquatica]